MKPIVKCATIGILPLVVSLGAVAGAVSGSSGAMHAGTTATMGAKTTPSTTSTTRTSQPTTLGPSKTGQPNQSCGSISAPNTPGNAATAPGSAFNPDGQAGSVYAGQQPQNSRNTVSVSQYDVACSHQPR